MASGGEKSRARPEGGCCEGRNTNEGAMSGEYGAVDVTIVDRKGRGVDRAVDVSTLMHDDLVARGLTRSRTYREHIIPP